MKFLRIKEVFFLKFLIKRAKRHDNDAFVELMESQKQTMYKVARSYLKSDDDIADAIQETILACYEKLNSLENEQFFKTWLIRILINNCINILNAGRREYPAEQLPEQGGNCMSLENYEFYELLNSLDEKYRTILILYYVEGFKIREIAQILDMDESTVKTRLSRGRKVAAREYLIEPARYIGRAAVR